MALSHQVEQAARIQAKPIGGQIIDDAFLAMPAIDPEIEDAINREAAISVADMAATRHSCELDPAAGVTVCTHPHHERDTAWAQVALDFLGLHEQDERASLAEIAVTPEKRKPRRSGFTRPDFTWQDKAACQGENLVLFFGPPGERRADLQRREALAKKVCTWCPVRASCLEWAFTQNERHGVWGGLGEEERDAERRRWLRRRASDRVGEAVDAA